MTFFGKWHRNILLSAAGALAALLLLEFAVRVYLHYYPQRTADLFLEPTHPAYELGLLASDGQTWITQGNADEHKFIFHPYLVYKNLPDQHTERYNVNSLGLRGEEISPSKSPDVFRLIVIGGSTAFGQYATTDAGTWPYMLQQKLNACRSFSKRVEVLNAGVIGYITAQELVYLQMELLDYSPDLVIALNGYNDFFGLPWMSEGCARPRAFEYSSLFNQIADSLAQHALEENKTVSSQIWSLFVFSATKTYIGKFLYNRIESLKSHAEVSTSQRESKKNDSLWHAECVAAITDNYKKNLQKMARLLNSRNVPFIIALQPVLLLKKNLSPLEKEIMSFDPSPWYNPAIVQAYPQMAAAAAFAENDMTTFFNLTDVFGDRAEDIFIDSCHLNDHGNEIVAQFLAEHLCNHQLTSP